MLETVLSQSWLLKTNVYVGKVSEEKSDTIILLSETLEQKDTGSVFL